MPSPPRPDDSLPPSPWPPPRKCKIVCMAAKAGGLGPRPEVGRPAACATGVETYGYNPRADLLPRTYLVCVVVASGVECRAMARKPNGTSREHILSRLERDGRQLLLDAVRSRRISAYSAAELAGYVKRRPTLFGDDSQQAKRRRHEIARLLG
jgi:hypothetical protein